MSAIISKFGGIVVNRHDCSSIQIMPFNEPLQAKRFYSGPVYSYAWLIHSIKSNELLLKEDYLLIDYDYDNPDILKLDLNKRSYYTVTEVIKIW